MVTSCPAATGPCWLGRRCPNHRCISRGGGRRGGDVQAGTCWPVPCCRDGTTAHQGHTSPPRAPQCHPGRVFGHSLPDAGATLCHSSRALGSPAQSQGSRGPRKPPRCRPHGSCTARPAPGGFAALCPPDQATLCKSKLIRLHGYRHRNMRCILSLSINALYHPIKLIKKQSSSSHQVPRLNIINFILWLMIVSADGEHAS